MATIKDDIRGERVYMRADDQKPNLVPHALAYTLALPYAQNKKVLDLCCGTGFGTKLLSEAAEHVIGVDYSETAIEYALRSKSDNTEFLCRDAEEPLTSYDPDVITCMQGLEHLNDPGAIISKYADKTWVFALPNGGDDIEHHHYNITEHLIQKWFNGLAILKYFDDTGKLYDSSNDYFTNYFGVYNG